MSVRTDTLLGAAAAFFVAVAVAASGCGSAGPGDKATVSFYRVRVELSTTSEGAAVDVRDTRDLMTARVVAREGPVSESGASMRRVWLRRAVPSPDTGETATITVDWALSLDAGARGLDLSLAQRGTGSCNARLSSVRGDVISVLEEKDASGDRPVVFSVGPGKLAGLEPDTGRLEAPTTDRTVWAFYYTWYDSLSNWDSRTLSDRPSKPYTSDDRRATERQVREAEGAGIDGFLSSWWGPGSTTDENLATLLDVARENDFEVAINFETLGVKDAEGRDQPLEDRDLYSWLRYAISTYGDHPAYTKVDGKPLVVLWASNAVPLETWNGIISKLRDEGLDACFIGHFGGDSPDLAALEVFDGLNTYNILNVIQDASSSSMASLAETYETTGRGVNYYGILAGPGNAKVWAATAEPGYDDHLIPERHSPVLDRRDGSLYEATFEAAVSSDPDMVFVTSWNEWWEHTYIEPSERFGDRYLEITRSLVDGWKK